MTETMANWYSSESSQRELSNEYQHHDRVELISMMFSFFVHRTKVTSAKEGLTMKQLRSSFKFFASFCIVYKYDIPVWCTTGITPPREECGPRATLLSRGSYSCCTPHRDVIFVLLYRTTYKTQKGEN